MTPHPSAFSYVRFSNPKQARGDSLRRQIEASRKYAEAKGFKLDENLTIKDLGVSAFKGDNKTKGALSVFLKGIEDGTIPSGSLLIIESLDRLSREQIISALNLFLSIVESGITIVTLIDHQEYSRESINNNPSQIMISIMVMQRSHDESKTKSDRVKKSWESRRKNAGNRKTTSAGPAWLKFDKKSSEFLAIPERAQVIEQMFQWATEGHGVLSITKQLNKAGFTTFKAGKPWRKTTVHRYLINRRVIGEYQPTRYEKKDGRHTYTPEGLPIPNYYPSIIDEQTFYAVQERMKGRKRKGGRWGKGKNLFPHLIQCGYCGAVCRFIGTHGGRYYYHQCDSQRIGAGCKSPYFPYANLESAFLSQCTELDVGSILPNGNGRAQKVKLAKKAVDAAKGMLANIELRIQNYDKAIDTATSDAIIERFVKKLTDAEGEKTDAEKQLSDALMALNAAQSETATTDQQLKSLKDLIHKLEKTEGQDLIALREKLKNAIAGLVERITIFPDGLKDRILTGDAITGHKLVSANDLIAHYENIGNDPAIFKPGEHDALIGNLASYTAQNSGKDARAFLIEFKAGGFRLVKRQGKEYVNEVSTLEAILSSLKG